MLWSAANGRAEADEACELMQADREDSMQMMPLVRVCIRWRKPMTHFKPDPNGSVSLVVPWHMGLPVDVSPQ